MTEPMKSTTAPVHVDLGSRAYDIHIGPDLIDRAGDFIAPLLNRPHTAIITDANVERLHLERLKGSFAAKNITCHAIVVPAGEASKSVSEFGRVCEALLSAGIERRDTIIALGGGVVGDLAGFAAASVHRGIGFVQIPTSLLAQVDSSVGGKTGINLAHGKNLVGAFHQPALVLADTTALDTLPERELRAGYAEVVKYAFINDVGFFDWLETNADAVLTGAGDRREYAIRTSCEAKAAIVAEDEREGGVRAILNLGHTFGHAFEAAIGYTGELLHGEAVALGMVCAFNLSAELGYATAEDAECVRRHLQRVGLSTELSRLSSRLPDADGLVRLMGKDKKVVAGTKTLVLACGIGKSFLTCEVDDSVLTDFLARKLLP